MSLLLVCAHTDILVPLPRTDLLASITVVAGWGGCVTALRTDLPVHAVCFVALALLFAADAVDTEDSLYPAACMFAVLFALQRLPCCSLL